MTSLAFWLSLALGHLLAQAPPPAPGSFGPDTTEPGSVEAIAAFTTEPRFGSPWVAYVPDSAAVPSPTKYLGHVAGAPGELSSTTKIHGYFLALAGATARVHVEVIGRSDEGRDILLAAIADEDGICNLAGSRSPTPTSATRRSRRATSGATSTSSSTAMCQAI